MQQFFRGTARQGTQSLLFVLGQYATNWFNSSAESGGVHFLDSQIFGIFREETGFWLRLTATI